jgi:hypothetical protein
LPPQAAAEKISAATGNIFSRWPCRERQSVTLQARGDAIFPGNYRVNFEMVLPIYVWRQQRQHVIRDQKRILFPV